MKSRSPSRTADILPLHVAPPAAQPERPARHLWICCHLPRLPLEIFRESAESASAVTILYRGRAHVLTATKPAESCGVRPGLSLPAALTLCPDLHVHARDEAAEAVRLKVLAESCLAFTPWVSLDFPGSLLLEVGGSLRLFGGLKSLRERLEALFAEQGHEVCIAAAPVALAAALLAAAGKSVAVRRMEALRGVLGALPVAALAEPKTAGRLEKAGLCCLRDLWRLPAEGLSRRFGTELTGLLALAAGQKPEVLGAFHEPPRFSGRLDLALETESLSLAFQAIDPLLAQATVFLNARDAVAAVVEVQLHHRRLPASVVRLELRRPSRDRLHWRALLEERLGRVELPAPFVSVSLSLEQIGPRAPTVGDLFAPKAAEGEEDWSRLVEILQARLGAEAVRGLAMVPDYRPELASKEVPLDEVSRMATPLPPQGLPRPAWLLERPRPAPAGLRLHPGVERIEAGWWDGAPITRDYRIADDGRGVRCWVFRRPDAPGRWYLHGFYG